MSYIKNSLSRDEGNVKIFQFHWLRWFWFLLWIVLILASLALVVTGNIIVALIVAAPFILLAFYEYFKLTNVEMGVTNKRVIYKEGIISRKTKEMKLTAIENITIEQTFLQRLLNVGSVKVIGRAATPVFFTEVKNPLAVKKAIEDQIPSLQQDREDDDSTKK
jgi:uncharacterized MnhB-related membrane protein